MQGGGPSDEQRDLARRFLELQEREFELRELEVQGNLHFSEKSIGLQFEYAIRELRSRADDRRRRDWIIGALAVAALVTLTLLVHLDATDLAADLVKIVLPSLITGFGAYHYGKRKVGADDESDRSGQ